MDTYIHTCIHRSNYNHSSVSGLNKPERRMWYLLADQMKDGGRGLIEGSNWSSCVISTSLTLASGPCGPGGFQSGWSSDQPSCRCLEWVSLFVFPALKPFSGDWWSESWWLLKSGIRTARITPLANTSLPEVRRKKWMRLLLTPAKSLTHSRSCQFPDSICSHR